MTNNNKGHVQKVWGDEGKAEIFIPKLIDDYNHWMGGVDVADQRIAYYNSDLRCQRNWIPMFLQVLSIIRTNSYIVHSSIKKKEALSHKKFTLGMIEALLNNAHHHRNTSHCRTSSLPKRSPVSDLDRRKVTKRARTKKSVSREEMLSKYPQRKAEPRSAHKRMRTKIKRTPSCVWCSQLFSEKKALGSIVKWDKEVKRTPMYCVQCSIASGGIQTFLCDAHFDHFHDTD